MNVSLNDKTAACYRAGPVEECFPQSKNYRDLLMPVATKVCEKLRTAPVFPFSERHLQCVWHDARLRPKQLRTSSGERVFVDDPGQWNLAAGPDFLGATLRVGSRRFHGDVEIHVHPEDWKRHGHQGDPRYSRLIAHVTWFPGPLPADILPAAAVEIALQHNLQRTPSFSFEQIDLTAYPFQVRGRQTPCAAVLAGWSRDEQESLLISAGEERLRRRAAILCNTLQDRGIEQVFFEEMMRVLGYHQNKSAFYRLARIMPLARLLHETGNYPLSMYAVLLAFTGKLPEPRHDWDMETQRFVRGLWDCWWRLRELFDNLNYPVVKLQTAGIRPANRPERRLMAAAYIFAVSTSPASHWLLPEEESAARFIARTMNALTSIGGTYWGRRNSWSGKRTLKPVAFIGHSRAADAMVNVIVPLLAAQRRNQLFEGGLLNMLPATETNSIIRRTAHTLFGLDHPSALYANSLRSQGLLQIFQDFCLNDRSGCQKCEFPRLLENDQDPMG